MIYTIKSHPTIFNGIEFRSRLEAKWACFFSVVGFGWQYEPIDLEGWVPDFLLTIPCKRDVEHNLYVEVKPFSSIEEFDNHPVSRFEPFSDPSPAKFGIDPRVTYWEMAHGDGGGIGKFDYMA